ncbi:MAG: hypothetical protein HGA43_09960, partial [Nitrospirae bacterium]|nr:hypothetical protein [Nitrospirota bacterium]
MSNDEPVYNEEETGIAAESAREDQQERPEQQSAAALSAAKQEVERPATPSRFLHFLVSISVRYKIAGTLIVIMSLAVISLGVVTFTQQNAILRQEMKNRAETLVNQLANVGKEGLLTKQELPVYSTIMDIRQRDDVVYDHGIDN